MSMTTESPVTVNGAADRVPARRRRWVALIGVALLAGGWWWASTPRLDSGLLSGVWSADHEIIRVEGPETTMYVVPAGHGETTLAFALQNTGPLPLKIIDVWSDLPGQEDLCFWSPTRRELRSDPQQMFTYRSAAEEARGAVVTAGQWATVWITGAHPNPDRCTHDGATVKAAVDVTVSIAGRRSTRAVPLGYLFAYTDDPVAHTRPYGSSVIVPSGDLP
jgi:hypothetical protein